MIPQKFAPSLLYHLLAHRPYLMLALQGVTYPELAEAILVQAQGLFEGLRVELYLEGGLYYLKVSRGGIPYDG